METMFETVEIKKSDSVYIFDRSEQSLPRLYNYNGEEREVEKFLDRTGTTALLVLKDNTITFEEYYLGTHSEDRRISWSTSKSFLSAVFGVAVFEGSITSLQDSVTKYVPELIGSGYDGVSIKNVLQMSSGVRFDENYENFNSDINRFGRLIASGGSFDEFAASLTNEREPGTFLHYVSLDTHVLGMVIVVVKLSKLLSDSAAGVYLHAMTAQYCTVQPGTDQDLSALVPLCWPVTASDL